MANYKACRNIYGQTVMVLDIDIAELGAPMLRIKDFKDRIEIDFVARLQTKYRCKVSDVFMLPSNYTVRVLFECAGNMPRIGKNEKYQTINLAP